MSRKTYAPVKHTRYLECIDQIPPAYCRLVAREKKRGGWHKMLTITQIAAAAGLSWQRTAAIARRKSFASVTVEDADKFRTGCGITLQNEKRHMEFIRRNFRSEKSFDRYFRFAQNHWPSSWRKKYLERILKRL